MRRPRNVITLTVLVLLSLSVSVSASAGFFFNIPAHGEECYLVVTPPDKKTKKSDDPEAPPPPARHLFIQGAFSQIDERNPEPIVFFILDHEDKLVDKELRGANFGKFYTEVQFNSKYWLCLQNHNQGPTEKYDPEKHGKHIDGEEREVGVSFMFVFKTDETDQEKAAEKVPGPLVVEDKYTSKWLMLAEVTQRTLTDMVSHVDFLSIRESMHRDVTEKTFTDVLVWTFIEAAVVISIVSILTCEALSHHGLPRTIQFRYYYFSWDRKSSLSAFHSSCSFSTLPNSRLDKCFISRTLSKNDKEKAP